MRELTFQPVAESHVPVVERWLEDRESRRRSGGMIPFRPVFDYQQRTPGYHLWMVTERAAPVGRFRQRGPRPGRPGVPAGIPSQTARPARPLGCET
jgi:hypothetical protein